MPPHRMGCDRITRILLFTLVLLKMSAKYVQQIAESLRREEVYYNVTSLIKRLIELKEEEDKIIQFKTDYKVSATDSGWKIETNDDGFMFLANLGTKEIYNHEHQQIHDLFLWSRIDEDSFYFEQESEDFWKGLCKAGNIELVEMVIDEYWLVSDQLAERLENDGEPVFQVHDLTVWGRMFTGLPIAVDKAIQKIAKRLQAA